MESLIKRIEREIVELRNDIYYVKSDVGELILQNEIKKRQEKLIELDQKC